MYRHRFSLTANPLGKDAQGKTFFDKTPAYQKLKRRFAQLAEEPGLGLLTAEPGVGKTAAIRNLCAQLPRPDYLVLYLCDTSVSPLDLYRTLALELGVRPCTAAPSCGPISRRRSAIWSTSATPLPSWSWTRRNTSRTASFPTSRDSSTSPLTAATC